MIVEVIAVGTELLLGQIVNTNGSWIGARLAEHGFDAHHQVVIGDNLGRLTDAIRTAIRRSDAVIITGGIGPTPDDLTREAMSAATGRPLLFSEDYAQELRDRWAAMGREFPENNLQQAEYLEGGEHLPNPKGTAPGIFCDHDGTLLFALPGVPPEMHLLMTDHVLPRLREASGDASVLVNRVIRTWGRGESAVAEILEDLYRATTNPSIAYLASGGEIKVRVSAKAATEADAETLIAPIEGQVRERLGSSVFAVDDDTIETVVMAALRERGWTIGTAESMTAGLVAARLTHLPGSSAVVRGGVVAYSTDLKASLLGVDPAVFETDGVVSEATALAMANGARDRLGVDVAVGVTGSAGPEPQEQPPGTVCFAVVTPDGGRTRTIKLPGDRERVRTYAATAALHLVRLAVTDTWWS
jgi:nicotinamide-nucleotide amidase